MHGDCGTEHMHGDCGVGGSGGERRKNTLKKHQKKYIPIVWRSFDLAPALPGLPVPPRVQICADTAALTSSLLVLAGITLGVVIDDLKSKIRILILDTSPPEERAPIQTRGNSRAAQIN